MKAIATSSRSLLGHGLEEKFADLAEQFGLEFKF